jgi:hypothetical protein
MERIRKVVLLGKSTARARLLGEVLSVPMQSRLRTVESIRLKHQPLDPTSKIGNLEGSVHAISGAKQNLNSQDDLWLHLDHEGVDSQEPAVAAILIKNLLGQDNAPTLPQPLSATRASTASTSPPTASPPPPAPTYSSAPAPAVPPALVVLSLSDNSLT